MLDAMVRYENTKKAIDLFYDLKKKYTPKNPHLAPLSLEFKRMAGTHGRCYTRAYIKQKIKVSADKIVLNEDMVNQAKWHDVKETLLHEFAHAIDCGISHHGREWVKIARDLGLENPTRTSSKDYEMKTKYTSYCSECGAKVSSFDRMGSSYQNGRYISRCCRAKLTIKQNY